MTTSMPKTDIALKLVLATLVLGALPFGCATGQNQVQNASDSTDSQTESRGVVELLEQTPDVRKLGSVEQVRGYQIGSVKVLHKRTPANSVVSAKLYFNGGTKLLDSKNAGIQKLALGVAASGGTTELSKDEYRSALNAMGSSISSFTERDYAGFSMKSIKAKFDKTWSLFEQAVMQPRFPKSEVGLQKKRQLASIRRLNQNPDRLVGRTARNLLFENHPYGNYQLGTAKTVRPLNAKKLKSYYRTLFDTELLLVVVGDISKPALVEKVKQSFGRIAQPETPDLSLPEYGVEKRNLQVAEKDIPTNYVVGVFPAPAPAHDDYPALKVAMSYLSDRLFEEVRTKRNLTYAVSAGLSSSRTNYGYLYASPKKLGKTMEVIFNEIDALKSEQLPKKALQKTRNVFLTEHLMDLETNSSQAGFIGETGLVHGDWREHAQFLERIKTVTASDVQRVAKKYLKNYQFGVVGQPDKVKPEYFGISNADAKAGTADGSRASLAAEPKPSR